MTRYLISFDDGAMTFPPEDLPAVAEAAHAVLRDAKATQVWITGGGFHTPETIDTVDENGVVTAVPVAANRSLLGGFCILEIANLAEAHHWAGRFAKACRCAQEVRPMMDDPEA